jgi:hypothetical protein
MADAVEQKKIWVTLTGLPLTVALEWPFHRSTSGADFWVLHGDIRLENSDGLHAPVAVNLSATEHLLEVAGRLVSADGLVRMEGEWAEATPGLMGRAERFESAMRSAVEELEKKHAFERG